MGVKGDSFGISGSWWDSSMEISSPDPFEVPGELAREGWSKTISSGPLEWWAEPESEASSSSKLWSVSRADSLWD